MTETKICSFTVGDTHNLVFSLNPINSKFSFNTMIFHARD